MTDQHIDKKPKVEEGDQKPDTLMVALVPSASNLLQGEHGVILTKLAHIRLYQLICR